LLKPPKFGNCTIDQQNEVSPLITISDIKHIFGSKNDFSALDDLKKKSMVLLTMETGSFLIFLSMTIISRQSKNA